MRFQYSEYSEHWVLRILFLFEKKLEKKTFSKQKTDVSLFTFLNFRLRSALATII